MPSATSVRMLSFTADICKRSREKERGGEERKSVGEGHMAKQEQQALEILANAKR